MGKFNPGLWGRYEKIEKGNATRLFHNRAAKSILLADLGKVVRGDLGLSEGQKRQYVDEATRSAQANIDSQAKQLGAMQLAAGPQYSGQYAQAQRQLAEQQQQATAGAQAEAERIDAAKEAQDKATIMAELARQQNLRNQRTQFYMGLLFGTIGDMAGSGMANMGGGQMPSGIAQGLSTYTTAGGGAGGLSLASMLG